MQLLPVLLQLLIDNQGSRLALLSPIPVSLGLCVKYKNSSSGFSLSPLMLAITLVGTFDFLLSEYRHSYPQL